MKTLTIRRYEKRDLQEVKTLHRIALESTGAYLESGKWDRDLDKIEDVYINPGGEFIVGLMNGKIITMGALKKISDDTAELKRMRVHPKFQKQGLGQKILDELHKIAHQKGFKKIFLNTSVKQVAAQRFYQKNGYKEVRRETKDWPLEVIFYEKSL